MSKKACIIGKGHTRIDGHVDEHSDKCCCCGGHNWHNKKGNKRWHSTAIRLRRRLERRFRNKERHAYENYTREELDSLMGTDTLENYRAGVILEKLGAKNGSN